jgi:hypothetical protein
VVTELVEEREIWIIPMMNPDGLEAGSRYNANGVDLNRNYGYMREDGSLNSAYSQPETQAIRTHALAHSFGLSLSYHSGAYYINYLWNYTPVRTPDDAYIVELSEAYDDFVDYGITEGYEWYQTKGDCNDWSYGTYGGMDWTIELGDYEPPQSQIDVINALNQPAIIDFVDRAIQGIGGVVTDGSTGEPLAATVNIAELDWPVFTQLPLGDYHRPLPPGTYTVVVSCPGYETSTETGIVVSSGQRTIHHVALNASVDQRTYARLVVSADSPNYNGNYPYPTHGHDALGAADSQWFSLGKNGWIVVDMGAQTPITDTQGDDVKIREGGSDGEEGYNLYLGNSFNGPWTMIGSGSGTASFDMSGSGLSEARYVYVKDDNIGSAMVPNPGFDLDAVEVGAAPDEPYLILTGVTVDDPPPADDDGRLDPGESALLYIEVTNIWAGEATAVVGTLSTADQYVVIDDATDGYPGVPGDSSAVNLSGFAVTALTTCPEPHVAEFTLSLSALGGYSWDVVFDLMIGQHELLYVDTDNEATETRITAALDTWGGSYRRLNAYNQETVPSDTLGAYRIVLWAAGDQNTSSMTAENQTAVAAYLDQGGALLFTGENYLSAYGSTSFTTDYLHVSSYETSISGSTVTGEAGDPIGDGITVTLDYPAGLAQYPDGVTPDTQAAVVFRMQGNNNPVAIRSPGDDDRAFRVVFFAAPLEAFPSAGTDPHNIETVVVRCLTWLDGGEDLQPPTVPTNIALTPEGTLTWSASIDNVGVDHYNIYQTTYAYFTVAGLTPEQTTSGTSASFPQYVGNPAVNHYFRVTAEDAAGNESSPSLTVGEYDSGIPRD